MLNKKVPRGDGSRATLENIKKVYWYKRVAKQCPTSPRQAATVTCNRADKLAPCAVSAVPVCRHCEAQGEADEQACDQSQPNLKKSRRKAKGKHIKLLTFQKPDGGEIHGF